MLFSCVFQICNAPGTREFFNITVLLRSASTGNITRRHLLSEIYGYQPSWLYASASPCSTVTRSKLHPCYEQCYCWRSQGVAQDSCRDSSRNLHPCCSYRAWYNRSDHILSGNVCCVENFRDRLSSLVRNNAHPQRYKGKSWRSY